MRYIGIDPGLSGGIAAVDTEDHVWVAKTPESDRGILDLLARLTRHGMQDCYCVIEHVWTSPQMGVVSAGTFMKSFGGMLMALEASRIPFEMVAPVKWQNMMGVRTPKDRRAELGHKDKNINKRKAEELFPGLKVTHAIADALLLAVYARLTHRALLIG